MHVHRSLAILALLPALAVMLVLQSAARAQSVPTTTVSGNVYQANGRTASGSLQISWPAFTTAAGQAVAAGRTSVGIGSDGKVSVALAPNIGAMPAGLFYTAVYHLNDGTTSTEYWVVPNTIQATIAQVRAAVMPAAQAVQAVNKAYVDQSIAQAVSSQITPTGGTLTGPLYLAGDPTQAAQAANKHYVDSATAQLLPIAGGTLSGPVTAPRIGAVLQADQFPGADFGAQLQACVNALDPAYGGTCDARNFPGQVTMAANLRLSVPNVTIYLPCSTIATAASILVPGGTRNVSLHGCASRGTSAASGAQGGTVLLYSGNSALLQVGDSSFLADTKGFRLDNAALNITAAPAASAQAIAFYRTQEISLASLYVLGNGNQTGLTLDGTGNYSGGTFEDLQLTGFQAAISGIGHTVDNAATTDWLNASTFLRMHIDCPTQNGSPVAGTTGIDLQAGDGNTFTGGDVEGCAAALRLGAHAVNNTLVGVRNENSTTQIQADAGSSYNNWITGGTMYTGKLVDNGTRNSFLDTFHRSFNGVNGDWYGSQQDATVTNHYRLGIGTGSERGLQDRYQTDFGYRWTTGLSDASAGIQYYQVLDELNHVYRLSLGQYNNGQGATNNQTVLNAAGTGAVILNGSNNAGTGGVVFGSGGPSSSTVATVDQAGNANFLGTMLVGGVAQSTGTMTVRNNADAEVDYYLWPGVTSSQKGSFTYKDFNGSSQWYMVKDQWNNWALNSAPGGLDSFKAYQSTNSGDTYINAAKSTGHIRLNYETGAGAETDIYSGSGSSLAAAFLGPTAIKLPGLAAASGKNCLQIDSSGYLSNTASGCGFAATVMPTGLAFSDGSVQTTSQQGAVSGQANDAMARSAAATAISAATTAEGDAQSGITNASAAQTAADAAQTLANSALNGQANDATARTAAVTATSAAAMAEGDAQSGITNAAAAQTAADAAQTLANSALNGQANDATARSTADAAQATASAALTANGVTTSPGGSANFPGSVAAGSASAAQVNNTFHPAQCANSAAPSWCAGLDIGAWVNAAAAVSSLTTPSRIVIDPGIYTQSTQIVLDRPVALEGYGSTLIPGTALQSMPVAVTGTVTLDNPVLAVSSATGLSVGQAIGGFPIPAMAVITAISGTNVTLSTAPVLNINAIPVVSAGNPTMEMCGLSSLKYLAAGQGVSGANLPGGTTITALFPHGDGMTSGKYGQCMTLSAAPTSVAMVTNQYMQSVPQAVAVHISGGSALSVPITAVTTTPMIRWIYNASALRNQENQMVGGSMHGIHISDTSNSGLGRTLTGVQGVQIGGWDRLKVQDFEVDNLKGTALLLGGYNVMVRGCTLNPAQPLNCGKGVNRESQYKEIELRDSGDPDTGQSSVAIMDPLITGDRTNQIHFQELQATFPYGEAVTIGSYHSQASTPGLIWFTDNTQIEGGAHSPSVMYSAPFDLVGLQNAYDIRFAHAEILAPGYGKSVIRADNAYAINVQDSQITANGSGKSPIYNVAFVSGGTNLTVAGGIALTSSQTDGEGAILKDSGTCSSGCAVWLAASNSITNGTTVTLAYNPSTATGGTLQIFAGGYYITNTNPSPLVLGKAYLAGGNTYGDMSGVASTLLGFDGTYSAQEFWAGNTPSQNWQTDAPSLGQFFMGGPANGAGVNLTTPFNAPSGRVKVVTQADGASTWQIGAGLCGAGSWGLLYLGGSNPCPIHVAAAAPASSIDVSLTGTLWAKYGLLIGSDGAPILGSVGNGQYLPRTTNAAKASGNLASWGAAGIDDAGIAAANLVQMTGGKTLTNTSGCVQGFDTKPCIVASVSLTGQTASKSQTFFYTPPNGAVVESHCVAQTTTAGTGGTSTVNCQVGCSSISNTSGAASLTAQNAGVNVRIDDVWLTGQGMCWYAANVGGSGTTGFQYKVNAWVNLVDVTP